LPVTYPRWRSESICRNNSAVWLITDAQTDGGTTGLSFVERLEESRGEIIARFPGVRRYKYWLCDTLHGSNDRPASWTTGQSLILRVRTVEFTCESRQELFDRFSEHRRITVRLNSTPPSVIPLSAAFDVIADKYDRQNWVELDENRGYYAVGTDHENPYGSWQPGWVGGGMSTLALIELGNEKSIEHSIKTLEFAFTRGLAKGGLPYGLSDGKKFYGDQFASPQAPWQLIRKSGDLLFYAVQQIRLLKQLGRTFPDTIQSGAMTLAGALESVWRRNGQLGQFVNHDTLDVIVPGSTSGAIVPAALALAAQEFDRPDWLDLAVDIADQYWRLDGEACVQTGAAGEIMQSPDCEAAVAFLESFVTLYEQTHDRKWLDRATRLAVQCLTWQFAYDFEFPKGTLFEKLGIRTRGGWLASVQNIGPCPAMCSHSGATLLRLFRYTGDGRFMNMLTDNTRVVTQYLSTEERPIGNQQPGWISERIATTDAINDLGTIFDGSCWPETSVLLMAAELPSVYVRRDLRRVWSLDVIEAELQKDCTLQLMNPTKMTAKVRICFETPDTVANTSFHSLRPTWKVVHLPAGDTMNVPPT